MDIQYAEEGVGTKPISAYPPPSAHFEGTSRDAVDLNLIPVNAVFPPRIKKREQTKRVLAAAKAAAKAAAAIGSRRRG